MRRANKNIKNNQKEAQQKDEDDDLGDIDEGSSQIPSSSQNQIKAQMVNRAYQQKNKNSVFSLKQKFP